MQTDYVILSFLLVYLSLLIQKLKPGLLGIWHLFLLNFVYLCNSICDFILMIGIL